MTPGVGGTGPWSSGAPGIEQAIGLVRQIPAKWWTPTTSWRASHTDQSAARVAKSRTVR